MMDDMRKKRVDEFLASYSGMDGGNPNAPIWVCGIESGGKFESLEKSLNPDSKWSSWDAEFKSNHPRYSTWQYHRKVAKLMVALDQLENYPESPPVLGRDKWKQYMEDKLYVDGGENFKLNLFPLSSPRVGAPEWETEYSKHLDIQSKSAYYKRCNEVRFPFLRELRAKFNPEIILGTGKTFKNCFASAFGFDKEQDHKEINDGAHILECYMYSDGNGLLIVSPFFGGRYGVNSNGLLIELAKLIKNELTDR